MTFSSVCVGARVGAYVCVCVCVCVCRKLVLCRFFELAFYLNDCDCLRA